MTIAQRNSPDPLLIVGSMAFDDLDLPSGAARNVVGGSATYAAVAASLYTAPRIVAVVGDDFPTDAISMLESRGVDTSGIERAKGKTFRWAGRYARNFSRKSSCRAAAFALRADRIGMQSCGATGRSGINAEYSRP